MRKCGVSASLKTFPICPISVGVAKIFSVVPTPAPSSQCPARSALPSPGALRRAVAVVVIEISLAVAKGASDRNVPGGAMFGSAIRDQGRLRWYLLAFGSAGCRCRYAAWCFRVEKMLSVNCYSWPHTHPIRGATLNLFQKTWVLGSGNWVRLRVSEVGVG